MTRTKNQKNQNPAEEKGLKKKGVGGGFIG